MIDDEPPVAAPDGKAHDCPEDALPGDLRQHLTREFGLGDHLSSQRIVTDSLSSAFRVTTTSGTYCLKRHRKEHTAGHLNRQALIAARLARAGFDLTPPPVASRRGSFQLLRGEEVWSVSRYIESDSRFIWTEPTWTPSHCRLAGEALALFHEAGRSVIAASDATEISGDVLSLLPGWLDEALAAAARLPAEAGSPGERIFAGIVAGIIHESTALSARCRAVCALAEKDSHYPETVLHGDYHPGNLLFLDARVVAVLDLDHVHRGTPLMDLGYAAVFFCADWVDGSINRTSLSELISGYDPSDLRLIERLTPYMEIACWLTIYWLLDRHVSHHLPMASRDSVGRALEHSWRTLASIPYNPL